MHLDIFLNRLCAWNLSSYDKLMRSQRVDLMLRCSVGSDSDDDEIMTRIKQQLREDEGE